MSTPVGALRLFFMPWRKTGRDKLGGYLYWHGMAWIIAGAFTTSKLVLVVMLLSLVAMAAFAAVDTFLDLRERRRVEARVKRLILARSVVHHGVDFESLSPEQQEDVRVEFARYLLEKEEPR